jgi:hypothetical protein
VEAGEEDADKVLSVINQAISNHKKRTFDEIPKMAILDDEFNVYFVEKDGIEIEDGAIKSIKAKIINYPTAPKLSFTKEDVEIDTDDDDENDDEARVFEFRQIHFFDMRAITEDIQSKCFSDSFNTFLLEEDPNEISKIVDQSLVCVTDYVSYIRGLTNEVRNTMISGIVPSEINLDAVRSKNSELEECLNGSASDICRYVVNTLNTQFKILEDNNFEPNEQFPDTELSEDILDGFDDGSPSLTGAREYAAGIGDNAEIIVNKTATIEIIPRDAYDNTIPGDLSENIELEIISDTTGNAEFVLENGNVINLVDDAYIAKITSKTPGIVKIRARICNRTIQAVTYSNISFDSESENTAEVDCVPESNISADFESSALGALTRIDRVLSIYFIKDNKENVSLALSKDNEQDALSAKSNPQIFGTKLEN